MRCSNCLRPTRPLFTSVVCDYCDGLIDIGTYHGFMVFRGREDLIDKPVYVFRTRTDAARLTSKIPGVPGGVRKVDLHHVDE